MNWNPIATQWRRVIDRIESSCALSYRALSEAWIVKMQRKDRYPARRIAS
jgi:hypothetical protein